MAKTYYWKNIQFNGGESEDSRIGPPGSFRYGIGNDIHRDVGQLSVGLKPTKHSASSITNVVTWIEPHPTNGDFYLYVVDHIWKVSAGVYSDVRTIGAGTPNGQGLIDFNGFLYYRTGTTLGRYDYNVTWNDSWQTGLESMTTPARPLRFKNLVLIPNGRYVATVDDVGTWNATRLKLPPGYTVRSMDRIGSYAAIVAVRGVAITDSDEGMMFLWNGIKDTYDDAIPLNGNPHAICVNDNKITIIAGEQPMIQQSVGGIAQVMHRIPNVGLGKTAEVYPGAIDKWNGRIYFGISAGTSTTVLRVVREWGAKNGAFREVSNPLYPLSTGTLTGTGVQITALKKIGTTMYYAWKDGVTYGVDKVDTTAFQESSVLRSLVSDHETPWMKNAKRAIVELTGALKTNETVTLKIGNDPYDDPTFSDATKYATKTITTAGLKLLDMPLANIMPAIHTREMHFELTLGGSAGTKPAIKSVWVEVEENNDALPDK